MKNEKCEYQNDGQRITAPGKFEGCPVFAPAYWGVAMDGFADSDNGKVYTFRFTNASMAEHALDQKWAFELKVWLGRKRVLRMFEDDQGFVHCY